VERIQIAEINPGRYIRTGKESILYGEFTQIYEEFCPKLLFLSVLLVGKL